MFKNAYHAKAYAKTLKESLREEIEWDVPLRECLDAVGRGLGHDDWKAADKSRDWPKQMSIAAAAAALQYDAGVPRSVLEAAMPRLSRPNESASKEAVSSIRTLLESKGGRELSAHKLASKSADLLAGEGLRSLAHDMGQDLDLNEMGYDETDPRLIGITVMALLYWSRTEGMKSHLMGMGSSDESHLSQKLITAADEGNAESFEEAIISAPAHMETWWSSSIASVAVDVADRIEGTEPPRPSCDEHYKPLPVETHDIKYPNWGSRWRRLDAADLMMFRKLGDNLFGTAWIRTTTDLNDGDLDKLGINAESIVDGGKAMAAGGRDDAVWILGIGASRDNIAPVGAMHFARWHEEGDTNDAGTYFVMAAHLGDDAGRLREKALRTLGALVGVQANDDIENHLRSSGSDSSTITIHPLIDAGGETILHEAAARSLIETAQTVSKMIGHDRVIILNGDGDKMELPHPEEGKKRREGLPDLDLVSISSRLGKRPWGAVAVLDDQGRMGLAPLGQPNQEKIKKYKAWLDQVIDGAGDLPGRPEDKASGLSLIMAGQDAMMLCADSPSTGALEVEMQKSAARIAVFQMVEHEDGYVPEGVTYSGLQPGQSVEDAFHATLEKVFVNGTETNIHLTDDPEAYYDEGAGIEISEEIARGIDEMNDAFEAEHGIRKKPDDPLFAKGVDENGNVIGYEQITVPIDGTERNCMGLMVLVGMQASNHAKIRTICDILTDELNLSEAPGVPEVKMPDRRQFLLGPTKASLQKLAKIGERIIATGGVDFVDMTAIEGSLEGMVTVTCEPGSKPKAQKMG